ncbi:Homeodomain-like DNA binding domain-containing transcription factor [Phycomyces blakesleeanus NRRL 1555(-)]|uniref:Homeodomain-like DNA binding domain-containing transcription factor n=1 Tax=Phycomyces blakesleeanus (strain ATCC 8743b / DSM 1359 / FGSC 10004 / NBRC 33097 / NRRL 1555) TaxID=763407 RepID=A0A167KMS2_PHYB8|nr:Homeodomain-like DNA binding domain-containing transcription factor [Phycomyces blakesleeanus NRRL 1555(-)]OAD68446.1 Homeodomain-like DNA binding domain-containing transcription factor [Phycomyces blakesleeanus NRRL 1555(-)]|eukprot:XP_018286486.1 Homeodomain-like DNA binding domain-containing transcription factor [Phycomyces blakesleeanus NRRL 1555(-)]
MKKKKLSMSNTQLADWAKKTFGLQKAPDASTISKILKIGVKDFSASQGWMEKFGKHHCIKMNRIHGEAGSTDIELLQINKAAIKEKIEGYSARDIYNFDETALFYAALPRTTISHHKFSGWKENKKRLTVGFLCNANETDKWSEILIIGHARRPNCFNKNNKKQKTVDHRFSIYHYNTQNHKALLILDNFSDHIVDYAPTNVELLFLPPNTTSHLQPLNGGII